MVLLLAAAIPWLPARELQLCQPLIELGDELLIYWGWHHERFYLQWQVSNSALAIIKSMSNRWTRSNEPKPGKTTERRNISESDIFQ